MSRFTQPISTVDYKKYNECKSCFSDNDCQNRLEPQNISGTGCSFYIPVYTTTEPKLKRST